MKIKEKIIVTQIVLSVLLLGVICYEYIDNSISCKCEIQNLVIPPEWINISVLRTILHQDLFVKVLCFLCMSECHIMDLLSHEWKSKIKKLN